jgi:hypothetical protein
VAIAFLITAVRVNNSASVDKIITISCLPDFQAIGLPKKVIRWPYINRRNNRKPDLRLINRI